MGDVWGVNEPTEILRYSYMIATYVHAYLLERTVEKVKGHELSYDDGDHPSFPLVMIYVQRV
jgi:hypothetical protein